MFFYIVNIFLGILFQENVLIKNFIIIIIILLYFINWQKKQFTP